jgi:hypothetical protein
VSVPDGSSQQGGRHEAMSWALEARCRDVPPEVFFPHCGAGVEDARSYCDRCPVRVPCLEYALENQIQLSGNGLSVDQDVQLRRSVCAVRECRDDRLSSDPGRRKNSNRRR